MRAIHKGAEPLSLTEHRCKAHADYDNYSDKDTLRASLVTEQRGLCCYCLSRIRPTARAMKIAHWHPQVGFADEQLSYANLLGACLGNEGQPLRDQHCDTRQGNTPLSKNPAIPEHAIESLICFKSDGTVSSPDTNFDRELNEVLNLNFAFLKNNRKAVLDGFTKSLGQKQLSRTQWEKHLADWNGDARDGDLRPYCQIVIYWLRKKVRQK